MSDDHSFEDTIRNLLRMKPKPHKGRADDETEKPDDEHGSRPEDAKQPKES